MQSYVKMTIDLKKASKVLEKSVDRFDSRIFFLLLMLFVVF